jgi:ankyrin repeat protein
MTCCDKKPGESGSGGNTSGGKSSAPAEKSSNEKQFEAKVATHIKAKADLNARDERGIPLLVWAAEFNYADAAKMLLENGADPNITPKQKATDTVLYSTINSLTFGSDPLALERIRKSRLIAELLIKHGANVNHTNLLKTTPLHQAALRGRTDLCELFIAKGANINALDKLGTSPLHNAAKYGYWETAEFLLNKGAQPNTKSRLGETPMSLAKKRSDEPLNMEARKKSKDFNPGSDYDKTIEVLTAKGAK